MWVYVCMCGCLVVYGPFMSRCPDLLTIPWVNSKSKLMLITQLSLSNYHLQLAPFLHLDLQSWGHMQQGARLFWVNIRNIPSLEPHPIPLSPSCYVFFCLWWPALSSGFWLTSGPDSAMHITMFGKNRKWSEPGQCCHTWARSALMPHLHLTLCLCEVPRSTLLEPISTYMKNIVFIFNTFFCVSI